MQPKATIGYGTHVPVKDPPTIRKARKQLGHYEEENQCPLSASNRHYTIKENGPSIPCKVTKSSQQAKPSPLAQSQLSLRRPLQQLSTNRPASSVPTPAAHLQFPAPSYQQLETTAHLVPANMQEQAQLLSNPAVTGPAPCTSSQQPVVHGPLSCPDANGANSFSSGEVDADAPQQQTSVQQLQVLSPLLSTASTAEDTSPRADINLQLVSCPKLSSKNITSSASPAAPDTGSKAPVHIATDSSSMDALPEVAVAPVGVAATAAAGQAAKAAAALQHLHSQHPVTQIIQHQQATSAASSLRIGGPSSVTTVAQACSNASYQPALQPYPSTTTSMSTQPYPGSTEPANTTRRCTQYGDNFPASSPSSHATPHTAAADTVKDRSNTATTGPAAGVTAGGRSSSHGGLEVLQILDAVKAKLQVIEAMQQAHGRPSTKDAVVLPPHLARQPFSFTAATRQGYAVHTAAPFAGRQQSKCSYPQRGQEELQLPTIATAGPGCSSLMLNLSARQLAKSCYSMPAGGSILDAVASLQQHPSTHAPDASGLTPQQSSAGPAGSKVPTVALQDRNKAAALAAASALAAGAIKPRPQSATLPTNSELHSYNQLGVSVVSSSSSRGCWKHWRSAADAMLPSQSLPTSCPAGVPTATQQASILAPKLQDTAMPQFLQQHVAAARRAAAALGAIRQQALASATQVDQQQQDDPSTAYSSHASCDRTSMRATSSGRVLQHPNHAATVDDEDAAALHLQQQGTDGSAHSRVGNRQVVAPLHGGLASRHSAGTAAAAVAQQQRTFAARVLQQLQPHASQHSSRAGLAVDKLDCADLRSSGRLPML